MWARVKHAIGALLGCAIGFGASVTLDDISSPSIASAPPPAGVVQAEMVLGLTLSKAHASGTKRSRRRAKRKVAEREAEEKQRGEADKKLEGTRRATLPADCVYDYNASASYSSDIYACGGVYYRRYEENGVTGYEGHAVGLDHGAIERAKARRAEAEKKRRAEAKGKLQPTRRAALPAACVYDSWASTSSATDVYACGGVRYRQYQEKGVTGFEVVKP
ncbi:MAG: hypothetical protein O7A66_00800 [Alphaproteobacteria bacterium]|nr:hypothetical protein [Alphaproteobacteria bacterium]